MILLLILWAGFIIAMPDAYYWPATFGGLMVIEMYVRLLDKLDALLDSNSRTGTKPGDK